jgi:hypothetical protein
MSDPRPAGLCATNRLSRRDWPLLPYRPFSRTTVQQEDTRAPSFLGVFAGHVFQPHQEQELSKKAKWIQ